MIKKYVFNIVVISLAIIALLIGAFVIFSSLSGDEKSHSQLILGIAIVILSICASIGAIVELYLKSKGTNIN